MKKTVLAAVAALAMLAPLSAYAIDVTETMDSAQAAAAVWAKVGDFCGIAKWHPAVKNCTLSQKDGATFRLLDLGDKATVLEKLVNRDDAKRSYSYMIVEGVLPVQNYVSTISVAEAGAGSKITWVGKFEAKGAPDADAAKVISGVYKAGLVPLAAK